MGDPLRVLQRVQRRRRVISTAVSVMIDNVRDCVKTRATRTIRIIHCQFRGRSFNDFPFR